MRELVAHQIGAVNNHIRVTAMDEIGAGGAHHKYGIYLPNGNAYIFSFHTLDDPGVTNEAFLAIVQDRLESFQKGPFPCTENARALHHVQQALHYLHSRTIDRAGRGVEGKSVA